MGVVARKTLDIWIPAGGFAAIIGTQLGGRSAESVLVDKMALRQLSVFTKSVTRGERRVGQRQEGKESRACGV